MKVFCNNQLIDDASLSEVLEPGFLFGWGAFETLLACKRSVKFLDEHLKRFKSSLEFLGLEYPKLDFAETIDQLLELNELNDAYIRITGFKKRKGTGIIVYAADFTYYQPQVYQKGLSLILYPYERYSLDPFIKIKSISYGPNRLAWHYAQTRNKDEAVFVNEQGFIQEGSRSNIFFIDQGQVYTPSLDCGLLAGITREQVINICQKLGLKLVSGQFKPQDLSKAQEVFITSSLMGPMPVCLFDQVSYDLTKYPIFKAIKTEYDRMI